MTRAPGETMSVEQYKAAAAKSMSEADFQRDVIELAQRRGWLVAHFRTAMTRDGKYITPVAADGKGFPDLLMVRGKRAVAAELKSEKGRLTQEQEHWLLAMAQAGMEVYEWRPSMWDEIERVLA